MVTVSSLDLFLDPANGWLTPSVARQIVAWQPDEELRRRIGELGQKASSGSLSPEEDAEYREYIDDGDMIAILQAKARRVLGSDTP
jgi:hypothetical protein